MSKPSVQEITGVLVGWLQEEIDNSDAGSNAYLSDFDNRRTEFFKDFYDPTNEMAQKAIGHNNRFNSFATAYAEDWRDERAPATLIFAALMAVSGAYREQCLLEAASAEDYWQLRHHYGPTGISVTSVVKNELAVGSSDVQEPGELVEGIIVRTLEAKEKIFELKRELFGRTFAMDVPRVGFIATPDSELVNLTRKRQEIGVGLAVAHIGVAAALRDGSYEAVPILSPTTIGEATIAYPFAA